MQLLNEAQEALNVPFETEEDIANAVSTTKNKILLSQYISLCGVVTKDKKWYIPVMERVFHPKAAKKLVPCGQNYDMKKEPVAVRLGVRVLRVPYDFRIVLATIICSQGFKDDLAEQNNSAAYT